MSAPPLPARRVLVVDDEPLVLSALRETLVRGGFDVAATTNPREALDRLRTEAFAVILSDYRMPEMTGLDFLVAARELQPDSSRILITAVLTIPTIIESINRGEIFRFLAKPWLREELLATIHNAVQRYELLVQNRQLQAETARLNHELAAANEKLRDQVAMLERQSVELNTAHQSLQTNFGRSLELVHRLLHTFDPLLGTQVKLTVEICSAMAETEFFSPEERRVLRTSAWLYEVGMLGVPRDTLHAHRAGRPLDEQQATLLRSHPVFGQALASFVDSLRAVGDTIRHHHERYDGTGYPDGLGGEAIPWTARCLAVAASYAESGLPKQQAIERVLAGSGTAFDPEAVRLFLKVTHLIQLPRQVREMLVEELRPGMRLASGIHTPGGLLLIGEGSELNESMINRIRSYHQLHEVSQRLLVYS